MYRMLSTKDSHDLVSCLSLRKDQMMLLKSLRRTQFNEAVPAPPAMVDLAKKLGFRTKRGHILGVLSGWTEDVEPTNRVVYLSDERRRIRAKIELMHGPVFSFIPRFEALVNAAGPGTYFVIVFDRADWEQLYETATHRSKPEAIESAKKWLNEHRPGWEDPTNWDDPRWV